MSAPDQHPARRRLLRILRLMAALAIILAAVAVVTIVQGEAAARSRTLVAVAIFLGAGTLLGMALAALPHLHQRKEQNDHGQDHRL